MYIQVDVPKQRYPFANWAVIALTLFFSITAFVQQSRWERETAGGLTELQGLLHTAKNDAASQPNGQRVTAIEQQIQDAVVNPPLQRGALKAGDFRLWQLVSHVFIHGHIWLLAGNMLFLLLLGNAVNARIGHLPFLAVYVGLGMVSGLAWLVTRNPAPMLGAAGAVAGIAGVFLVLYPNNECKWWTPQSLLQKGKARLFPSWALIFVFMAFDILGTMTSEGGIACVCHLAGATTGALVAVAMFATGIVRHERGGQHLLQWIGFTDERLATRRRKLPKPRRRRAA